ncbi:MAG: hypothetical protein U1E45_02380 [Geminicoccaceae bacterium]
MATFTVTILTDSVNATDGKLSLREALAQANAHADADTITFAAALERIRSNRNLFPIPTVH